MSRQPVPGARRAADALESEVALRLEGLLEEVMVVQEHRLAGGAGGPGAAGLASFPTQPVDYGPEEREISGRELRCAAHGLARATGGDVLLVLNWRPPEWPELDALGSTAGAIVATEDYHLFRLHYDRLSGPIAALECGPREP